MGARAGDRGRRHADRACIDGEAWVRRVAARALLKWPRSASVLQTPIRQTLGSTSHVDACDPHRAVTMQGISPQAFKFLHKIAEVDDLLRGPDRDATRVFEAHPELTFMQLRIDQGGPCGGVMEPKGKPGGHRVRRALLATAFGPDLDAALPHISQGKRDLTTSSTRSRRCGALGASLRARRARCRTRKRSTCWVCRWPFATDLRCRFGRPQARI